VIERTAACSQQLAGLLERDTAVSARSVVARACEAMEAARGGAHRDAVLAFMPSFALAHLGTAIEQVERELTDELGIEVGFNALPDLSALAVRLGLPAGVELFSLAHHHDPRARLLASAARLLSLRSLVLDGSLRAMLSDTWSVTGSEPSGIGQLARTLGTLAEQGIDGQALLAAAVALETHNHLKLIYHEAHKLEARYPGVVVDDMVGFGWQGLRAALRSYDPVVAAFSTYACPRINGAIRDGIRAEQPIPKRLTTLVNRAARAEEQLTQRLGRTPELHELAEHMDLTLEQLRILPRLDTAASLDELAAANDGEAGEPGLAGEVSGPEEAALRAALGQDIETALADLEPLERDAVRLLLLEGLAPREAAERLGVDTRRLRAAKQKALPKLAEHLASWA
jgi:RNA polymerase sigma factor (sigma-70 family)